MLNCCIITVTFTKPKYLLRYRCKYTPLMWGCDMYHDSWVQDMILYRSSYCIYI